MTDIHPKIQELLEKHDLSWEMLQKRGRPPKGVSAKRSAVVTELHREGYQWKEMAEMLNKSISFIQRNTKAVGNKASHQNRVENARKVGESQAGKPRPWVSEQMKERWENGDFDFHIGRERPEHEKQKLREAWQDSERREKQRQMMKENWQDQEYRENLLDFHRSDEERARRSRLQVKRMKENPEKWVRGNGCHMDVEKCSNGETIYVRSSYEKAVVEMLEQDIDVVEYQFEARIKLDNGKWILPDFVITWSDRNQPVLTEIKASWVFGLPDDSDEKQRLQLAEEEAEKRGWGFEIWTEEDRLQDVI